MRRRSLLPLSLLLLAFAAFGASAWALTAAKDLAGLYGIAVGLVALRAATQIAQAGVV